MYDSLASILKDFPCKNLYISDIEIRDLTTTHMAIGLEFPPKAERQEHECDFIDAFVTPCQAHRLKQTIMRKCMGGTYNLSPVLFCATP